MAGTSTKAAVAPVPAAVDSSERAYVDWPAILAGAVFASAIAFLFTTFGSAIGLSLAPLLDGERPAVAAVIAIGLWVLWVAVSSFMAGGYLTGRLRRRVNDAKPHEVDVRDGAHGLVMWAVGALIGAMLTVSSLSGAARLGTEALSAAGSAVGDVGAVAMQAVSGGNPDYLVDQLFRSDGTGGTVTGTTREEVGRLLAQGNTGIGDEDQGYLASLIAARTALSDDEAAARVSALSDELAAAAETAASAADMARKVGIITAFLVAVSLLIGAAGAWWAAGVGGRHRDEGLDFSKMLFTHRVR